jgi:polyisoprenoid-binding protein YceI
MSATTSTSLEQIASGTYNIDPSHSNVGFEVRHMGIATVRGKFQKFAGTVEVNGATASLSGTVDVTSLNTDEENRDGHLRSPEFFDVERYPQIAFHSTGADVTGDGMLRLNGEITIKGVTEGLELIGTAGEGGTDPYGHDRIGFEVEGKIDRRDFDLKWNQTLPNGNLLVANEVKLVISISAVKAA